MKRVLRIYRQFFVSSLQREMEFKANFWAKVIQNVVWMTFFIMILQVIYLNTDSVAGWRRGDSYILAATCFLMNGFVSGFLGTNVQEIPDKVRKGTLDFDIVKPIDTQFLVSVRKFNFDELGTMAGGVLMVLLGTSIQGYGVSGAEVFAYVWLLLCSAAIFYSFLFMLMTTGIWLVRVENLWVLGDSVFTVARFPLDIFKPSIRGLFTYIVPLGFIATIPSRALIGRSQPSLLLYGLVWAIVFLVASRLFWRFALRHYTSASS